LRNPRILPVQQRPTSRAWEVSQWLRCPARGADEFGEWHPPFARPELPDGSLGLAHGAVGADDAVLGHSASSSQMASNAPTTLSAGWPVGAETGSGAAAPPWPASATRGGAAPPRPGSGAAFARGQRLPRAPPVSSGPPVPVPGAVRRPATAAARSIPSGSARAV